MVLIIMRGILWCHIILLKFDVLLILPFDLRIAMSTNEIKTPTKSATKGFNTL